MAPVVVVLGPTGAGKSYQAEQLAATHPGWEYISTGELLRKQHDPQINQILESGKLAPSEMVQDLLSKELADMSSHAGIVFDGFPRMTDESDWLDGVLRHHHRKVDCVLVIEVSFATSLRRLNHRGRTDDDEDSIRNKWEDYHSVVQHVISDYDARNLVVRIDGNASKEVVSGRINEALAHVHPH